MVVRISRASVVCRDGPCFHLAAAGEAAFPWGKPRRFLREVTGQGWRGTSGCRVTNGSPDQGCRGVVEDAGLKEQEGLCPQGLPWGENGGRCCATHAVLQRSILGIRASPWVSVKNQLLAQKPFFLAPECWACFFGCCVHRLSLVVSGGSPSLRYAGFSLQRCSYCERRL